MAYLGDLTADVEVYELEAVAHLLLLKEIEGLEQFAAGEAELTAVASAFFPLATARGGQLDADADVGLHVQLACQLGDEFQLVELLHHEEDALAHLLCQQGQLYEALVLIAVADDEGIGIHVGGYHRMKLRLGTSLQAKVVFLAVADDLFHHGAHLIHFNRIDDEVLGLVFILFCSLAEAGGDLFDTTVQDVWETYEHRGRDIAKLKLVYQLLQVDLCPVFARGDHHMTFVIDTKV